MILIPDSIGRGRKRIIIDDEINKDTILKVLQDALTIHNQNVIDMKYLIDYYKGKQNILTRENPYASDINNKVVLNYAFSSVRDIVGYTFGKDAEITQRKVKNKEDIEKLSDIFNYENSSISDTEAATLAAITGIGYEATLPTEELTSDYMPDIPIVINSLDVLTTFVIQSARIGNPVRLSCTYWYDGKKYTYFTAFTDTEIYYIKAKGNGTIMINSKDNEINVVPNIIGLNPISMIQNNAFLMGDFEVAITVLDALNQIASDSVNDVENVIKSLLVIINAELEDGASDDIKKNRILELVGNPGLGNVDAKFIYQQLDATGIQNLREYLEEAYKIIIGIPDRKTRGGGGGDTGDAVKLRDGWADIEVVARIKEKYFKVAKKKQIAVAIAILKGLNLISQELKLIDIDIKLPRNKNDNLQTKAQSYSTIIATKTISPEDALNIADMTTDTAEVIRRGEKYWKSQKNSNSTSDTDESKQEDDKQNENKQDNNKQDDKKQDINNTGDVTK